MASRFMVPLAGYKSVTGIPQVEEERKEAEAIKEKVAKDEAAVATRQEEVTLAHLLSWQYGGGFHMIARRTK